MNLFLKIATGVAMFAALAVAPASAEIKKGWTDYKDGDVKLKAYTLYDDAKTGKRPAIFMIHAREGMSPRTLEIADNWAKLGYVVFVADIFGYGQGILPKTVPEMEEQTDLYSKNVPMLRKRVQAGYDTLLANPMVDASRIALIGYCFGGSTGVEFAATGAPLALNVSIHGSFRGPDAGWAEKAKGRFLILHGSEDKGYPVATKVMKIVDDLRAANRPFLLEVYSGTGHGFSTPKGADEERANAMSIETATKAMKEAFGS